MKTPPDRGPLPDRGEAGQSLLEVIVASVLLVSVLMPLAAWGVYGLHGMPASRATEALHLGQQHMETTLQQYTFTDSTWAEADSRWRIERTATPVQGRVVVRLKVFFRDETTPEVSLMTQRLLP